MELALQFGWGMMDHTRSLIEEWGATDVLLSPRDLSDQQLRRFARDVQNLDGRVLLDPQFYLPHSDHERLVAHDYWPNGYDSVAFWTGPQLEGLLRDLSQLRAELGASRLVLPGLFATRVNDDWLAQQAAILEEAERAGIDMEATIATVALGDEAVRSNSDVEMLLEESRGWSVGGVYLICEHPNGDYLVQEPNWLANQVDLVAGWRLRAKEVLVGYANHQNLICAAAGANAIASGTWMNVRSFPPDKFRARYEEEIKRRTTWFYAPATLSEFKIPFMDIAARQDMLDLLKPTEEMRNARSDRLFAADQPSTAAFSEKDAFRHYLHCLRAQAAAVSEATFDDTCSALRALWDEAEERLGRLHSVGVNGQMRDFGDSIDACRAALAVLETTRGPLLRRHWGAL